MTLIYDKVAARIGLIRKRKGSLRPVRLELASLDVRLVGALELDQAHGHPFISLLGIP